MLVLLLDSVSVVPWHLLGSKHWMFAILMGHGFKDRASAVGPSKEKDVLFLDALNFKIQGCLGPKSL